MRIFPYENLNDNILKQFHLLYNDYLTDLKANTKTTITGLSIFTARKSKHLIDKIDDLICPLYGLTQEETNFIKNYEIKFRSSDHE